MILREVEPLAERGKITGFLNNVKDGETLTGLADDIRDAMMDYQVRTHTHPAQSVSEIVQRLCYSETSITRVTSLS